MSRQELAIGDVFEAPGRAGPVHFQFVHEDSNMGPLVRVFTQSGHLPAGIPELVERGAFFYTYLPLKAELRAGTIRRIAHVPLGKDDLMPPPLRSRGGRDKSGAVLSWWIKSGATETLVDHLSPEQMRLSIAQAVGVETLVNRVEAGWTPETDEDWRLAALARESARDRVNNSEPIPQPTRRHYLYFKHRNDARDVALAIQAQGGNAEYRRAADGDSWAVIATDGAAPIDSDWLDQLAGKHDGEYDGSETAIPPG
jgi:hypothetical protein